MQFAASSCGGPKARITKNSKRTALTDKQTTKTLTTNQLDNYIRESLKNSAEKSLPKKLKSNKNQTPWATDQTFLKLLKQKEKMKESKNSKDQLKQINHQISKQVKFLKNEFFTKQADEINLIDQKREIEKSFRKVNENASHNFQKIHKIPCQISDLKDHFEKHFSSPPHKIKTPDSLVNPPESIFKLRKIGNYQNINQSAPERKEIIENMEKIKNNKVASDLPGEYIKYASDNMDFVDAVVMLFGKIWAGDEIPSDWGHSIITTLYKMKGGRKDPSMYRGLSIGNSMAKLFMMTIINRINPW